MKKHRLLINSICMSMVLALTPLNVMAAEDEPCEVICENDDISADSEIIEDGFVSALTIDEADPGAEAPGTDEPAEPAPEPDVPAEPEIDYGEIAESDRNDKNLSLDGLWITSIDDSRIFYTGSPITPEVRVYDGTKRLKEKVDYTLSYSNNKSVCEPTEDTDGGKDLNSFTDKGSYVITTSVILNGPSVTAHLKGSYSGYLTSSFSIHKPETQPAPLNKAIITIDPVYSYAGSPVTPEPVVTLAGETLSRGLDYTVSYSNNDKIGKASVKITGIGNYYGTRSASFTIKGREINDTNTIINDGEEIIGVHTAGGVNPTIKVVYKEGDTETLLKENVDYTLKYLNNKAVTTEKTKKLPKAVITGKGYYKGKTSVNFSIIKKDFTVACGILVMAPDITESAKAGKYATKITVMDSDGTVLKAGKDYSRDIKYYSVNKETGEKEEMLDKQSRPVCGDTIMAEVTGMGNYTDKTIAVCYRVIPSDMNISKAKVSIKDQRFAGERKAVTIPEKDSQFYVVLNGKRIGLTAEGYPDGFEIVHGSYVNHTKCGTAKVTIHGTGIYGGYKTVTYKIVPKSANKGSFLPINPLKPDHVEGELICLGSNDENVNGAEEAQQIADSYALFGLTVKSYEYKVYVFDCGDNDLSEIIAFGDAHGLKHLDYNGIYYLDSGTFQTDVDKIRKEHFSLHNI